MPGRLLSTGLDLVKILVGAKAGGGVLNDVLSGLTQTAGERLKSDEEWRDVMYSHWSATSRLVHQDIGSEWVIREFGEIREDELDIVTESAKKLIREHAKRSRRNDGSETQMMHPLAQVWKHLSIADETGEPDLYLRNVVFYRHLGQLTPKAFEHAVSAFHDDKIRQWFIRIVRIGKLAYKGAEDWLSGLLNRVLDALVSGDHETIREKLRTLWKENIERLEKGDQFLAVKVGEGVDLLEEAGHKLNQYLEGKGVR